MENGMYKYELHCHTKESSPCGRKSAEEIVKMYKQNGYDGIVITDHLFLRNHKKFKFLRAKKYVDEFLKGYREAKKYEDDNFKVFLGAELRFWYHGIDLLLYGIDENILKKYNLLCKGYRSLRRIADKEKFLIIAAHPYRLYPLKPNPKYIHGAEVVNGKTDTETNEKSRLWAEKHGLKILTSGSDFHSGNESGRCGILTFEKVETNSDFIKILLSGNYKNIGL